MHGTAFQLLFCLRPTWSSGASSANFCVLAVPLLVYARCACELVVLVVPLPGLANVVSASKQFAQELQEA